MAFLSYATRYVKWVERFHEDLEECLRNCGASRRIFFDQKDLVSGQSWVEQLEQSIEASAHLIVILTPEALASPWVKKEKDSFLATHRAPKGIHTVRLFQVPRPTFLKDYPAVDLVSCDKDRYREGLRKLTCGLLGRDPRSELCLPSGFEVPPLPGPTLPEELRQRVVGALDAYMKRPFVVSGIEHKLNFERGSLPSSDSHLAATMTLVQADNENALAGASRVVTTVLDELRKTGGEDTSEWEELETILAGLAQRGRDKLERQILPEDRLIDCVADLIRRCKLTPFDIQQLDIEEPSRQDQNSSTARDLAQKLAEELLFIDHSEACKILRRIADLNPRICAELLEVLDFVAPRWVTREEAVELERRTLPEDSPARLFALEAERTWTARSYICRALRQRLSYRWIHELAPPDSEDESRSIERQLLGSVRASFPGLSEDQIKRVLLTLERDRTPLFLILTQDWQLESFPSIHSRAEHWSPVIVQIVPRPQLETSHYEIRTTQLPPPGPEREEQAFGAYDATHAILTHIHLGDS